MLVNYTYENMLNKVKLISISTSTLSSMRTKFGHIWILSGWAYIKNWVDTQRDCIAFRPSRMRDHRLVYETIASRRVPSSSRDGLSRIRAIYISCQDLETYIARMRDGFSLQCGQEADFLSFARIFRTFMGNKQSMYMLWFVLFHSPY